MIFFLSLLNILNSLEFLGSISMDMHPDYEFQHLDITLATDCMENDIFKIVEKLRPEWNKCDVKIDRVHGGFLNKTFSCLHIEDLESQKDGLFVRVNGGNREALGRILPMENEIRYIKEMNKHNIGAPLLASCNNGIVLRFVKGKMVTAEQLQDQELERKVAHTLAQIHMVPILEDVTKHWTLREAALRCLNELDDPNLAPHVDHRYCIVFIPFGK